MNQNWPALHFIRCFASGVVCLMTCLHYVFVDGVQSFQVARVRTCTLQVVDLSHTCYNLIFVSGRASVLAPMLAVAAGQFGMLWIVGWTSPEYFFESGQWIVPISDYWSVNAMKCLSMLLTLFRVSGEFKDAAKLYRVLTHRPAVHMTLQQRILGFGAFLLQYLVAVVVLLMAIQLILASTTPIATIGKLWVVFATLDFDNYLCNFILFIFDCEP